MQQLDRIIKRESDYSISQTGEVRALAANGEIVNTANSEILAELKKSLKLLEDTIESKPIIFIDAKGKRWFNDIASELIKEKGLQKEDLAELLKIGSSHLQNLNYGGIGIDMMKLPGKNVIAVLRQTQEKTECMNFRLTRKEREVLHYLVRGFSNKQIADIMKIGSGTVNSHLDNIYLKLGCSNRLTACLMALKNGLFIPTLKSFPKKKK